MIYLFSQIGISLFLASIVGGAIGWLVHRSKANKQIRELQNVLGRQQQHVNEAQTEVSILASDFDDLKQRTDAQIGALKEENKTIPALNQNLEKSQLLVRQLMQQHKAEMDELVNENEKLNAKSKQVNERDKEVSKLQAELDIERRKNRRLDTNADSTESQSELQLDIPAAAHDAKTEAKTETAKKTKTPAARMPLSGNAAAAANTKTNGQAAPTELPSAAETEAELKALRDQLALDAPQPLNAHPDSDQASHDAALPHKISETQVDESQLEQMFESVEQHDDLKQIFGIGPLTEKTLNKLGITAYSQLADLKQHDIEKIAEALQIFPGRIERDNWVGGARAQLEEVLEDL